MTGCAKVGRGEASRFRIQGFLRARRLRKDLRAIPPLFSSGPDLRILDVGGGTGTATRLLSGRGDRVVVLEPERRKVLFGKERHHGVEFFQGVAEQLPFRDGTFDRVVALRSFHHFHDPDGALREIRRVLRTTGRFLLEELPPSSLQGRLLRTFAGHQHESTLHEPEALKRKLETHGLRDVTLHPASRSYFVNAVKGR